MIILANGEKFLVKCFKIVSNVAFITCLPPKTAYRNLVIHFFIFDFSVATDTVTTSNSLRFVLTLSH